MIDEILSGRRKRTVRDLNIVPILDMLTTIIFFLLLSTSFTQFTKLTVPPSSVSTVSSSDTKPISPKLLLTGQAHDVRVVLKWGGSAPGELVEKVSEPDELRKRGALLEACKKLTERFAKKYPAEKSIQVALDSSLPYQDLISAMDGVREVIQDIVLASYNETAQVGTP